MPRRPELRPRPLTPPERETARELLQRNRHVEDDLLRWMAATGRTDVDEARREWRARVASRNGGPPLPVPEHEPDPNPAPAEEV